MQLKEFYVGYQSVVFLLSICPAENISISLRPKTSFCAGVMIEMVLLNYILACVLCLSWDVDT